MRMSLVPDLCLGSFQELTVSFLKEHQINALILDIDNTLIPYEESVPTPAVLTWLAELKEAGIAVAFVSNNHWPRLETFNANLGYPGYAHSCKPSRRHMKKAMADLGADPAHTANMGDQIFTDVCCAHRCGALALLVPPIKDKTDRGTRFKRRLEKGILKRFYKRNPDMPDVRLGSTIKWKEDEIT